MILVVDASLAVKVITAEPGSEAADAFLEGHTLLAPELILAEVSNALWRKVRMGSLTPALARTAVAQLQDWLEPLVPLHDLAAQALDLALRRDHPVYDCTYVALAMRQAAPLATGDRRLAERFAGDADIRLIS
ncbi:type II toxin-antitoxin system VapC family toxin [Paeniroseomonas aquatica]|uniref:Ribonuclease VapC n=1 Tax=Paeniroseomonas aquatica TaxID=373043 RepID=A0ABT8A449_9PROT|nr:type II toxin-antitoxin system VapC family toxin [Paeniroseomonas aquatica]MDN3564471.1 type II toxin-antitoxin system VapC family toxin [Paeniroseomonas aquatica]